MRREKDLNAKLESVDVARSSINNNSSRIEELEHQLRKIFVEKNDVEIEMEEAVQDSSKFIRCDLFLPFTLKYVIDLQRCVLS